jgi:hypothetical protein
MNQPPLAPGVDQATGLGDINPSFLPLALRLEGVHLGYRPAVHVPERDQPAARHLLLVTVQRVNDVFNAPTAGGPTPDRTPDYEAFADFAARLQRLRLAGLVGLNWEPKEHESAPPGRNPHFWLHSPDPHSPLAADVAAVRHYLGLEPGKDDFRLTAFPFQRQPTKSACAAGPCSGCSISCRRRWRCPCQTSRRASSRLPRTAKGDRSTGRGSRGRSCTHPLAAGPAAAGVHRCPAPRLVVLHRRRRPELEGDLQPGETSCSRCKPRPAKANHRS